MDEIPKDTRGVKMKEKLKEWTIVIVVKRGYEGRR